MHKRPGCLAVYTHRPIVTQQVTNVHTVHDLFISSLYNEILQITTP